MPADAPVIQDGSGKVRLLSLHDLDRRCTAARRAQELVKSIHADLGGEAQLATGEKQIVQRAALLGCLAEDLEARWLSGEPIDPGALCAIGNAQRRLFEAVGLRRQPRDVTPSVAEYVERVRAAE